MKVLKSIILVVSVVFILWLILSFGEILAHQLEVGYEYSKFNIWINLTSVMLNILR